MRKYECMVIVDPDAEAAAVKGVSERIAQILTERGGSVSSADEWGRRRLAYEIDRKQEGQYLLVAFEAPPEALTELDRVLSLADEILRFKIIKLAA